MNPHFLILRQGCQKHTENGYRRSHICVESKKDTNEPTYETERDSQIQKLVDAWGIWL